MNELIKEIEKTIKQNNDNITLLTYKFNMAHFILGADGEISSIANQPYASPADARGDKGIVTTSGGKLVMVTLDIDDGDDVDEWDSWRWKY